DGALVVDDVDVDAVPALLRVVERSADRTREIGVYERGSAQQNAGAEGCKGLAHVVHSDSDCSCCLLPARTPMGLLVGRLRPLCGGYGARCLAHGAGSSRLRGL